MSSKALVVLAPVGLILSPSIVAFPVDVAMGLIIPYHMLTGFREVLEDYVKGRTCSPAFYLFSLRSSCQCARISDLFRLTYVALLQPCIKYL
jgi:succinate dehydrogenase hydrophobic anchor subunit